LPNEINNHPTGLEIRVAVRGEDDLFLEIEFKDISAVPWDLAVVLWFSQRNNSAPGKPGIGLFLGLAVPQEVRSPMGWL
jgi:hypothetical protein